MVPRFAEQRVARFAEHVVAVPVPRILEENSEVVRLTPHGSSYFLPLFYRFHCCFVCMAGYVRSDTGGRDRGTSRGVPSPIEGLGARGFVPPSLVTLRRRRCLPGTLKRRKHTNRLSVWYFGRRWWTQQQRSPPQSTWPFGRFFCFHDPREEARSQQHLST